MALGNMGHFMSKHGCQLTFIVSGHDKSGIQHYLSAEEGCGIDGVILNDYGLKRISYAHGF